MDANGLRFWMVSTAEQWTAEEGLTYDAERRTLQLARSRRNVSPVPDLMRRRALQHAARSRLDNIPQTRDQYGARAFWNTELQQVAAVGAASDPIAIYRPTLEEPPTDLAMGADGVLYVAIAGHIILKDLGNRWDAVNLAQTDFTAWRLATDPNGGVWVLDRNDADPTQRQLARVQGLPLLQNPPNASPANTFMPCEDNPDPPRLTTVWSGQLEADEEPIAIASSPQGQVSLLTVVWPKPRKKTKSKKKAKRRRRNTTNRSPEVGIRYLQSDTTWTTKIVLNGIYYPYSFTWISENRVAVLATDNDGEAFVYTLPLLEQITHSVDPLGEFYPLRNHNQDPFVHGLSLPPHYPTPAGSNPLYPISLPTFVPSADVRATAAFDSGQLDTVWHRLYIEAVIPSGCTIQVYVATSDFEDERPLFPDTDLWYPHQFGERFSLEDRHLPTGVWVDRMPSEIPYHQGLLPCPIEENRSGLFTVLIQRANRRVRTVKGRYLWVWVTLSGTGRATPELAAVRAYSSRFSYVENYLPELYRESEFGPEADQPGPSTPADFLERFINNFEGILTPLEDRIAHAYSLTDPYTTQEESLEWLGSWLGVTFDPAYPTDRRRQMLTAMPELFSKRGTLAGLNLALEILTNGGVSSGEIVVVEDFRLGRTYASILGLDLSDGIDRLTQGPIAGRQSSLGENLWLGDATQAELLALLRSDIFPGTTGPIDVLQALAAEQSVTTFMEHLAFKITVLVHQSVAPQDLGLINRVVESESPAHVQSRVVAASPSFLTGMFSLVGVDTYLGPSTVAQAVRIDKSRLGIRDTLQRPVSLDPRLAGRVASSSIDRSTEDINYPSSQGDR